MLLNSVTIPDTVNLIGEEAFANCKNLTSLSLDDALTEIGANAFQSDKFTSLDLPLSLKSIGEMAFSGCTNLSNLVLPKALSSIGSYAFTFCQALSYLIVPSAVTSIVAYAFSYSKNLKAYAEASEKPTGWDEQWAYGVPSYFYSETSKTNCWHYLGSVPTLW